MTNPLHRYATKVRVEIKPQISIEVNKVAPLDLRRLYEEERRNQNALPFLRSIVTSGKITNHLLLFWYEINGRTLADPFWVKLYETWDSLIHRRTNGAIVILVSNSEGVQPNLEIPTKTEEFIKKIYFSLGDHLPNL